MNFLADESIDLPLILRMRHDGEQVSAIAEDSPGAADEFVLARAFQEQSILITADKDFGELVYRRRQPHAGVLLLRFSGLDEFTKCELLSSAIAKHKGDLGGAFSVLDKNTLRIRHNPFS